MFFLPNDAPHISVPFCSPTYTSAVTMHQSAWFPPHDALFSLSIPHRTVFVPLSRRRSGGLKAVNDIFWLVVAVKEAGVDTRPVPFPRKSPLAPSPCRDAVDASFLPPGALRFHSLPSRCAIPCLPGRPACVLSPPSKACCSFDPVGGGGSSFAW